MNRQLKRLNLLDLLAVVVCLRPLIIRGDLLEIDGDTSVRHEIPRCARARLGFTPSLRISGKLNGV
jgi:hypothetical protein